MKNDTDIEHKVSDQHGRQILTVGKLRELLADADADTHVVVSNDGWYSNIEVVIIPGHDYDQAEHIAVTLHLGEECDARQW